MENRPVGTVLDAAELAACILDEAGSPMEMRDIETVMFMTPCPLPNANFFTVMWQTLAALEIVRFEGTTVHKGKHILISLAVRKHTREALDKFKKANL